jgi:hypothetical protein
MESGMPYDAGVDLVVTASRASRLRTPRDAQMDVWDPLRVDMTRVPTCGWAQREEQGGRVGAGSPGVPIAIRSRTERFPVLLGRGLL